jgi:hypothetical protein
MSVFVNHFSTVSSIDSNGGSGCLHNLTRDLYTSSFNDSFIPTSKLLDTFWKKINNIKFKRQEMAPKSMQIFKFNFSTNYFKFVETNLKGRRYQEMIKTETSTCI